MLTEQQIRSEIKAALSQCFESREKLIELQNAHPEVHQQELTHQAIIRGKLGGLLIALGADQNSISSIVGSLFWIGLINDAPNVAPYMDLN